MCSLCFTLFLAKALRRESELVCQILAFLLLYVVAVITLQQEVFLEFALT